MKPSQELIDSIYRERVLRARATPIEQKMELGIRLFEMACRLSMDGIRDQHPGADEAEVRRILGERIAIRRRLEERR